MQQVVYCPSCGFQAQADDMNMESLMARCKNCSTVYSLKESVGQERKVRPLVALPPGIDAVHYPDGLDVQIKWRKSASSFLLFFTIFWNIIVIPMAIFAFFSGEWGMMLGLSLHLIVGMGLLYFMTATMVNVTYIYLDYEFLSIQHRPFTVPWYPDREIETGQIKQLTVERYVASKTNGRPDYRFAVYAKLSSGKKLKVVQGLKTADQGRYIEQEVEQFLAIEDAG